MKRADLTLAGKYWWVTAACALTSAALSTEQQGGSPWQRWKQIFGRRRSQTGWQRGRLCVRGLKSEEGHSGGSKKHGPVREARALTQIHEKLIWHCFVLWWFRTDVFRMITTFSKDKKFPWFTTSNKNFHQCMTHALEFKPAKQLSSFQRQTIHTKELPFNMNLQTGKLEQALRWTSGVGDSGSWTALRDEQASMVAGSCLPRQGSSTPQRCDKCPEPGSCSPPLTGPPPLPWVNTAQQGQDTWIVSQHEVCMWPATGSTLNESSHRMKPNDTVMVHYQVPRICFINP